MKKVLFSIVISLFFLLPIQPVKAQILKRFKDKVSSKVENKVNNAVDKAFEGKGSSEDATVSSTRGAKGTDSDIFANAANDFKFKTGSILVFSDDLSRDSIGSMAQFWKASGSGSVANLPDQSGNWLLLKEFTSYKLKSNAPLPNNFTLEFDIATQSNTDAKDLMELKFGFAHDNAINNYISDAYNDNAITSTSIHYWNKTIINSSSDTKIYNTIDFPLAEYAVGKMHVAIEVKNKQMVIYLDKVKVLDTEMFSRDQERKYFYVSTGTELSNGAAIGISNFKVASF
ncbi:hypothetical protein [Albibacterium bauzanense]|uniref:Polysaccharide lyase-like protein n=1 Tax=Albibacterium bauzanense TaxID=653929 RepID=A0A4R1LP68_9SPHI|nr:hypothetical protein [Albibacterium bauzanense]TCK80868.1 hypothetical protein C8N28_2622 [Albibacterium bauzanense]